MRSTSRTFSTISIYMLSVTDFYPKKVTISEVRVHAAAKFGHTGCCRLPNAVGVHAGTAQVDFEVDRPPPADSPPGDLLITMDKGNNTSNKRFSKKSKKLSLFVFLIDLIVMKRL